MILHTQIGCYILTFWISDLIKWMSGASTWIFHLPPLNHWNPPFRLTNLNAQDGCLRDILARYLQCKPKELSFSINKYGKPVIDGQKREFNLSHSGNYVLIAVAQERKVGIDVEKIRSNMEIENMASRFFSPIEASELMALPPEQRDLAFFNCWTRKEAYIKAQGLGLSLPLDSFDVSLSPGEPAILRATRPDAEEASRWTLFSLDVDPRYAATLAVEGQDKNLRFWDWKIATQ